MTRCARRRIVAVVDDDESVWNALQGRRREPHILKSMAPAGIADISCRVWTGKKSIPPAVAMHLAEHLSDEVLTEREIEVLRHVSGGNSNKIIAAELALSVHTIKGHLKTICQNLAQMIARTPSIACILAFFVCSCLANN